MAWEYQTWEYRVVSVDGTLAIYEVYYREGRTPGGRTENPTFPRGESVEEFEEQLRRYVKALDLPILMDGIDVPNSKVAPP